MGTRARLLRASRKGPEFIIVFSISHPAGRLVGAVTRRLTNRLCGCRDILGLCRSAGSFRGTGFRFFGGDDGRRRLRVRGGGCRGIGLCRRIVGRVRRFFGRG